jgi:glutathione S-transferase
MPLTLHFHPLASFCQKVLIALYENETPFTPHLVDLADEAAYAAFRRLWPVGKMPVLHDKARRCTVPESSVIVEYLDHFYPGPARLIPADPDLAWRTRLSDRFYDHYVHHPMQKIVTDKLRPAAQNDALGVAQARTQLTESFILLDHDMAARTWAMGDTFTLADCAAAPALFYANLVAPFAAHKNLAAYFERLSQRPSFARVVAEAQPYFANFPG